MTQPETDDITGVETTGHEWDGIKELNNPLPRWWLWVFYATVIWSVGYWIVMPSWPLVSSYTEGVIGWSSREAVADQIEAAKARQSEYIDRIRTAEPDEIRTDPDLLQFALAGGDAAFGDNCAPCHGSGAQGSMGYPNLNDDAWIWGGSLDAIHETIRVGIRSEHPDARFNLMPAYLRDGILNREQVNDVAEYVLSLTGRQSDTQAASRGAEVFAQECALCHQEDGTGSHELGAPDLTDQIWLYGGDKQAILKTVAEARNGVMPAWEGRLDEATIKQLTVYVHSLGGGE